MSTPNFFFLGEIIHGDYREWANTEMFDSTTNYVAYKGLWSSLNDRNYFEIAYTLDQQFGEAGAYRHLPMYNFLDNHDVNRIVNQLHNPRSFATCLRNALHHPRLSFLILWQ